MMPTVETPTLTPQKGPQTAFLACKADIAIYGGQAGGGKSYALLLEPLRHLENRDFGGVIFRRSNVQIKNEGGLWDESWKMYPPLHAEAKMDSMEWTFPSGFHLRFAHLEMEKTVYDWHGSQIPFIGFDELTSFTELQFWYMFSRLRSVSGVPGYIRATCNPDPDSFVRTLIDWWIGEDGYPVKERSGKLRWFVRVNERLEWGDSKAELHKKFGKAVQPKSLTFIHARLQDNKILMDKDPSYLSNLMALSYVERMRLLEGNWNVRALGGSMFREEWFPVIDAIPSGWVDIIRYWDRAGTKPHPGNPDPDWTRGLKLYLYPDNTIVVGDLKSARDTPGAVETLIKNVASMDSQDVRIMSAQDPGSAGVAEAENFTRMLAGFNVATEVVTKDKINRAKPVSAQCEAGNVKVLRAGWNKEFFRETSGFPEGSHDDIVDCLSGGFNNLISGYSILDVSENLGRAWGGEDDE